MLEIKVSVQAPELAGAISALAAAMHFTPIRTGQEEIPVNPTMPENTTIPAPDAPGPIADTAAAATPAPATPPTAPTTAPPENAQPAPVTPSPVPTASPPTFSREQIMTAGAALIDAGKINELMTLLNSFGVQAVTQIKQEQLGAFATELRKLGAQI